MAQKKLVIVESPAKAKTIGKILGNDYVIKSSKGHIRDLPVNRLGVDIKNGYAPQYVVVASRKKIAAELKKAAESCEEIYLCPDPDREGEAIAWHLKELLDTPKVKHQFHRVQYNEITPRAVREAFENPGDLDQNRVDAQQARRVLDRIVGYMVSPLLWRRIRRGLSAGRVQSVALKLVCDREKEIRDFKPEAYWIMGAVVRKLIAPLEPFQIKLSRIGDEKAEIKTEEQAATIQQELDGRDMRVESIKLRKVTRRAQPPFITSTLQQAASSQFNYSPNRTMSIAQKLYEGMDMGSGPEGLITYMRTDSFNIAAEAREACNMWITQKFGAKFVPEKPNTYKSRASAQEAHEAIRPTDVTRTPESLKGRLDPNELKVYGLIWRRFVASQMMPAILQQRTVTFLAETSKEGQSEYRFTAGTSDVEFPGFMKVMGEDATKEKKEGAAKEKVQKLPALTEGERLACLEWLSERKETQPPTRFSEAGLVRELERNGVGRPSTYAATVSTLNQRKYVSNEKRSLMPSELGEKVNELLQETLAELFNVTFTATMEDALDGIEKGDQEWTGMIDAFYSRFKDWMASTKGPSADHDAVRRVLLLLEGVKEWAEPVKRGKRTYSDEKFVASIAQQLEAGDRPISERQFEAIIRIAGNYKEQLPDVAQVVKELGKESTLLEAEQNGPRESTVIKLKLLSAVEMEESTRKFVDSLGERVAMHRGLTDAQLNALNSVVVSHSELIPGFEGKRESLDLSEVVFEKDEESEEILNAMSVVSRWNEPVKRGRKTYDDSGFYESLRGHFRSRQSLSPRQKAALKKMVSRYGDQIANYDELVEKYGLRKRTTDDTAKTTDDTAK